MPGGIGDDTIPQNKAFVTGLAKLLKEEVTVAEDGTLNFDEEIIAKKVENFINECSPTTLKEGCIKVTSAFFAWYLTYWLSCKSVEERFKIFLAALLRTMGFPHGSYMQNQFLKTLLGSEKLTKEDFNKLKDVGAYLHDESPLKNLPKKKKERLEAKKADLVKELKDLRVKFSGVEDCEEFVEKEAALEMEIELCQSTEDEIGKLKTSFEKMNADFMERITEIEASVKELQDYLSEMDQRVELVEQAITPVIDLANIDALDVKCRLEIRRFHIFLGQLNVVKAKEHFDNAEEVFSSIEARMFELGMASSPRPVDKALHDKICLIQMERLPELTIMRGMVGSEGITISGAFYPYSSPL